MPYRVVTIVLALSCVASNQLIAQRGAPAAVASDTSSQRSEPRYRLFATQNIWTFLLLDSSTGKIWQVQFSLSDSAFAGRLPVNDNALAIAGTAHVGRFTLRETQNIFTFLLLDQDDGRAWQVQWSPDEHSRGIMRSLSLAP